MSLNIYFFHAGGSVITIDHAMLLAASSLPICNVLKKLATAVRFKACWHGNDQPW
jgi:hypothetical protein